MYLVEDLMENPLGRKKIACVIFYHLYMLFIVYIILLTKIKL